MTNAEAVLAVKFKSKHDDGKLMTICEEDVEIFRGVQGLIQKFYVTEESTGAISGIYLFESKSSLTAFLGSELAGNIPARYGVIPDTLRIEQYDMALVLNDSFFTI